MDDFQNAHWTETRVMLWPHRVTMRSEHWIRLDPPAEAGLRMAHWELPLEEIKAAHDNGEVRLWTK